MKKSLQLSLAVLAVSVLTACGSGNSEDAADKYVGTWKSRCFSYKGSDGNTYYQTRKVSMDKVTGAELSASYSDSKAHSDSACTNLLGAISNSPTGKINIGAEEIFLGAQAHYIVYTNPTTGEARQGYMTTDGAQLHLVVSDVTGQKPGGWGNASPYTKQ